MAITPLNAISILAPSNELSGVTTPNTVDKASRTEPIQSDFSKFLDNALQKLDNAQKAADTATVQLATGEVQDIHSVMIALEKANLNFTLAVEVRNKALDAYREVMRMQI